MKKDYHMHPATHLGEERFHAFAESAVASGFQRICVTDHMPLSVSNAKDRIPAGKVADYCKNVRRLAEQYEDRIEILVGVEIDYHPSYIHEIEAVLKEGDFDVVLGSTHLNVGDHAIFLNPETRRGYAREALRNNIMAARSGYFDVLTHTDKFKGDFLRVERFTQLPDPYVWEDHIDLFAEQLDAMGENNVRLEVNPGLAFWFSDIQYTYPQQEVLQMALDRGLKVTYGSDAHKPEHVGRLLDDLRMHPVYGNAIAMWEAEA